MRNIYALLFVIFLSQISRTQSVYTIFNNLTSEDGLPVSSVCDITQDAYGFIWIASWDGVFRYDGIDFKKMHDGDDRYVEGDNVGGAWISTQYDGLIYYHPGIDSLKYYQTPAKQRFTEVVALDDQSIWGSSDSGLVYLDPEIDQFVLDTTQQNGRVYYLVTNGKRIFFFINKGKTWFIGSRRQDGTYNYEVIPVDLNKPDGSDFQSSSPFYVFPLGDSSMLYVTRYGWVMKKNEEKEWKFNKPNDPNIIGDNSNVILDDAGNLWINKLNGLNKVNIYSGESISFRHDPSINTSILPMAGTGSNSQIYIDRQGVLWAAKFSHGISRLNLYQSDFGLLRDQSGQPYRDIISAFEEEDGSFWVGVRREEDGLIHFDSNRNIVKTYSGNFRSSPGKTVSDILSHPFAWSLNQTKDGSIWVGTGSPGNASGGLNRINKTTNSIVRFKHDDQDSLSLPSDWVMGLAVDGSDRLWVSSTSINNWILNPVTEKPVPFHLPEIDTIKAKNNKKLFVTMIDNEGNVWLRSQENFYIINHNTLELQAPPLKINLEEIRFNYVKPHQDKAGRVWIADNGKLGYTMQPFHEVEEMNPLQLDGVPPFKFGSINSDEEGNLWIGTEIGLVKQNPESKETILYGYDRGLQGYDFSSNANYRGPSGKLYFWGNGGINIFDPLEIKENPFPPQMAVRELRLDDVSVTKHYYSSDTNLYLNPIIINPDVTVISIDIAPIHFGLAKPNDYQFQLIGFDENWRTGHGEITYTNLAPGNYSLKVKGKNLDGIWSDEMTMLSFNVLPPWWRTRWAYFGYILLFGFVLYGLARWQKARITRKEKEKSLQKELAQAKEIEKAYSELKATQTQLIHSEKMASLGELTAGIAHEIQNPLNFVNNFSEISSEMTDEIEEELEDGEIIEARKILKDLKSNLDKITHHGQRADNIVKNMLMHSRSQSGEKMPVDINAMAEEYIRLAYHGMRAKHSEFNADLKVFLDEKIPIMDLVPQDISRVLLNLITNALQAVYEKKKTLENGYVPTVALGTKYVQNESSKLVEITISDNGPGIPMELEEKIFQPFFTTKPTGEGTGLGLSLAYDIVKANGGEILVDSDSMTGSIFKIILPVK